MTSHRLQISLVSEHCEPVRRLAGFKATHRVPEVVNSCAEAFVASVAAQTVNRDLDDVYDAIRREFRLKRTQMTVSEPGDGTGTIVTPYFTYSIAATLHRTDPSLVVWDRRVIDIEEPDRVFAASFSKVFETTFEKVEVTLPSPIDVGGFIDHVEELDDGQLVLDYDRAATRCSLTICGVGGEINVRPHSIAISNDKPEPPLQLFRTFVQMQSLLSEIFGANRKGFDAVELLLV